jgi:hypothetical protein
MKNYDRESEFEEKHGGKGAEPSVEELIFIYKRLEKLSDAEILEEMQDESFPLRSTGFMKRRRREYQAAKTVLKERISVTTDQVVIEAKKAHIEEIGHVLTKWQHEIVEIMEKGDCDISYFVEDESLFGGLLSHCPSVKEKYQEYSKQRDKYVRFEERIINDPDDPFSQMDEEYKQLAIYAVWRIKNDEIRPWYLNAMTDRGESVILKIGDLSFTVASMKFGYPDQPTSEDLYELRDLHKELVEHYEYNFRLEKLCAIRNKLKEIQEDLLKEIRACNDSKSYIRQKCEICPDRTDIYEKQAGS